MMLPVQVARTAQMLRAGASVAGVVVDPGTKGKNENAPPGPGDADNSTGMEPCSPTHSDRPPDLEDVEDAEDGYDNDDQCTRTVRAYPSTPLHRAIRGGARVPRVGSDLHPLSTDLQPNFNCLES